MLHNIYGENAYDGKYKAFSKLILMLTTYSLSYFYIGYTIAYFTSLNGPFLLIKYGLPMLGYFRMLYMGLVMFGAGAGVFVSQLIINKYPKRQFLMILNGFAIFIGCLMLWIDDIFLVFILRFYQGLCVGLYSSIVPSIIKDFCPPKITNRVRAVNYSFFSLGLIIVYTLAQQVSDIYIRNQNAGIAWTVICGFPLILISIQTLILEFVFPYQSTQYLMKNGRYEQAQKSLSIFYRKYHVIQVLKKSSQKLKQQQISNDNKQQMQEGSSQEIDIRNKNKQINNPLLPTQQKDFQVQRSKYAIAVSFSVIFLQQFSGFPTLSAYGFLYSYYAIPDKFFFSIIIFLLMFLATQLSPTLIDKVNRKTSILIGNTGCVLASTLICTGMYQIENPKDNSYYLKNNGFIITGLIIFALNFGSFVMPVFDVFVQQVVPSNFEYVAKAIGWGVGGFILMGSSADWYHYAIFLTFSIWSFLSLIINFKLVIETKGKSKYQIQEQYVRFKLL